MYTNSSLSQAYRKIDLRVGISVDFTARKSIADAIRGCPDDIVAVHNQKKSLRDLEIPRLDLAKTRLDPRDVLEVIVERGEQEAEMYASQALDRIRAYEAGRRQAADHGASVSRADPEFSVRDSSLGRMKTP